MTKLQRVVAVGYGGLIGLSGAAMVALVLVLMLSGCGTDKDLLSPGGERAPSGIEMRKYQIVYTNCGTFTLDYPSDFIGPIPDGHARIGTPANQLCARPMFGDPTDTADSRPSPGVVGDPDSPERGDGDGTDVKARSVGDPTSDD